MLSGSSVDGVPSSPSVAWPTCSAIRPAASAQYRAAGQRGVRQVLVAGGVACNRRLREVMHERGAAQGVRAFFPSPAYCTDNAVMIAGLGWRRLEAGLVAALDVDASPRSLG